MSENLYAGDIAFGLTLQVYEDTVDMGGRVVEVIIQAGIVEK